MFIRSRCTLRKEGQLLDSFYMLCAMALAGVALHAVRTTAREMHALPPPRLVDRDRPCCSAEVPSFTAHDSQTSEPRRFQAGGAAGGLTFGARRCGVRSRVANSRRDSLPTCCAWPWTAFSPLPDRVCYRTCVERRYRSFHLSSSTPKTISQKISTAATNNANTAMNMNDG
jgi:hypothetical protein